MYQVLVVEDSADIQDLVTQLLQPLAHINIVSSVVQALEQVEKTAYDLILMDIMLDDGDGFTLTSLLRQKPNGKNIPIIFMTSKGHIDDKTRGFKLGAEDYIVKPFEPAEFKLRIESRLQKIASARSSTQFVRGNFKIEVPLHKVHLIKENKSLNLTPLEFKIFFSLVNNNEVVSRDQLSSLIWGEAKVMGRSVDTHVNSLRKKLGEYSTCIQAIYGVGYTFNIDTN